MKIALKSLDYFSIGEAEQYEPLFAFASKYDLIDHLYRRYVRKEDLENTKELVIQIFNDISFDESLGKKFLEAYDDCLCDVRANSGENGEKYGEGGNYCRPIRIINIEGSNIIFYQGIESELPLEEYDRVEGDPFWMRPKYMEERYLTYVPPKYLATEAERIKRGFGDVPLDTLKRLGVSGID